MAGLSSVLLALALVLDCVRPATALQQLLPPSVVVNRLAPAVTMPHLFMRSRYEDGEDRRLSQVRPKCFSYMSLNPAGKNLATSLAFESKRLRSSECVHTCLKETHLHRCTALTTQLEAYVNSEEDAADPLIGKIIAGSLLLTIFGLLYAVYAYYGADGLSAATYSQRAIRGM
eukprot:6212104-Pleurochrysis_carterae.AAC.3